MIINNKIILLSLAIFLSNPTFSQQEGKKHHTKKKIVESSYTPKGFVIVPANPDYKAGGFQRFLMGSNYRKEWTTPVAAPILDFKTRLGGLEPKKEGGGKETKSLRVEAADGREWALRSVRKYPEKALDPELRSTVIKKLVTDGISSSYPYGALSMGVFSKAMKIPYNEDYLVYIGDDKRLGEFRDKFKNTLALLESRDPAGGSESISTDDLILKLAKNNDYKVDQYAVLKIRLLDNFVMDFDRHEAQWKWQPVDSAHSKIYYPLPKDRDQVFYSSKGGILPKLISSKNLFPELQGFRAKDKNVRTFNRAARNFDRTFLTEPNENDWKLAIDTFLTEMSDQVIEEAMAQQPKEIQGFAAEHIIKTLKDKRNYFRADMMKYYRHISHTVSIVGSNQDDLFTITIDGNGFVSVLVNPLDDNTSTTLKLYQRTFDPRITKEIRVYGLGGNDRFVIIGKDSKIKIRIIGGEGNDAFVNQSSDNKVRAYDVAYNHNSFEGKFKKSVSNDPQNNSYSRLGYRYNTVTPGISINYNAYGFYAGPKLQIVSQSFRKEPYASKQNFVIDRSFKSSSYLFRYSGEFIDIAKNTDLIIHGDYWAPFTISNFFGIGNNTVFDKSKPGQLEYYRARYDLINASLFFKTHLHPWISVSYGPIFQYFRLRGEQNIGKFVANINESGLDPSTLYEGKPYLGGEASFHYNSKDNQLMPTKGMTFNLYGRYLYGMKSYTHHLTQVESDLSFFFPVATKDLVFATSFGGGHNFGNYEFEQAQYLGYLENLRGFRKQRFAGKTRAYNNTELRWRMGDINAVLFPATIGMLAFHDVGRVWAEGEKSNVWHHGYGGGLWLAPLNKIVITGVLSYSNEEKPLGIATIGFKF